MYALNVLDHVEPVDPGLVEARAPVHHVPGTVARVEAVVAGSSAENVVSLAAMEPVVADVPVKDIVTGKGVDRVVTTPSDQDIVVRCSIQGVRAVGSDEVGRGDNCERSSSPKGGCRGHCSQSRTDENCEQGDC
jgi:hypothetical protein